MLAMFIPVLSNSKLCVHLVASVGSQEHVKKKNNIKMVKKIAKEHGCLLHDDEIPEILTSW